MYGMGRRCPTVQDNSRLRPSDTVSFGAGLLTVRLNGTTRLAKPETCTRTDAV